MIILSDLKALFESEPSERQIKINRLKQLLDSMAEESDWNSNVDLAFQDHNYSTKIKVAAKNVFYIIYVAMSANKFKNIQNVMFVFLLLKVFYFCIIY